MLKKLMLAALALAVLVAPASGQTPERKNLQILNDVGHQVRQYTRFTIFDDVSASIEDGVVTLTGQGDGALQEGRHRRARVAHRWRARGAQPDRRAAGLALRR